MRDRYIVDTNVLIAASAADPTHPKDIDATPADPKLRLRVWQWLDAFQSSSSRMVLDLAGGIYGEYNNKLGFNDFGIQVVMHKWSTAAVDIDSGLHVVVDPSPRNAAQGHETPGMGVEQHLMALARVPWRFVPTVFGGGAFGG